MATLNIQNIKPNFDAFNPHDVEDVLCYLEKNVPNDFRSAHNWYTLFQELSSEITEVQNRLELDLQRNTEDRTLASKLQTFEEQILAKVLLSRTKLMDTYLNSPWRTSMHSDDHGRVAKDFIERRKYLNEKIVPLQLQENEIIRKYRSFIANTMVNFEGRSVPLTVVTGKMSHPFEEVRKEAFDAYWNTIYEKEGQLQKIFDELLENRKEQTRVVGARSYSELAFADLSRLDYNAHDCEKFRASILETVVPVIEELSKLQAQSFPTDRKPGKIKPWNAQVWPETFPQRDPCDGNLKQLCLAIEKIVTRIHPSFGKLFFEMQKESLLDIEPRKGKAAGAFCITFPKQGMPFIFANLSGTFRDALTIIHEFGHAIHGYATSTIPNALLRFPGMEFCEVASMGLEMLSSKHFHLLYADPAEAKKAEGHLYFSALHFWPFMAMMDGWQHIIYQNRHMSRRERNDLWKDFSRRYRPQIDWSGGYEKFEELGWFSRQHIFTSPFYYIDYGIAQLAAVQLWRQSRINYNQAVQNYIRGISIGGQRSLPELFEMAGLKFDMGPKHLKALVDELQKALKSLL